MNYYEQIKEELINNKVYKKAKDYSKNRNDLQTYYTVGKILNEASKHYCENIIVEYSKKLQKELGEKCNERTLRKMKRFYRIVGYEKWPTLSTKLNWSHYSELLSTDNINKINYYIKIAKEQNLSVRELIYK